MKKTLLLSTLYILNLSAGFAQSSAYPPLVHHNDVGRVGIPGSLSYHEGTQEYEISGSGSNIWLNKDEFHFVWQKIKGDFIIQGRMQLIGKGTEAHRKAGLMIRESLDTSAVMTAATIHGDGLTALQYRKKAGANVEEQRSGVSAPDMVQLERKGNLFIMSVARYGDPYETIQTTEVPLGEEVYAGMFICSHNNAVIEKATFSNVRIVLPAPATLQPYKEYLGSHIETLEVSTGKRRVEFTDWSRSLQAPNWMPDGKSLLFNSEGLIYTMPLKDKTPAVLPTGSIQQNNNDHVISFDGKWLGLSSSSGTAEEGSLVFLVPLKGGVPKRITDKGPSYLHGFSTDGKWMTYTGLRNKEYDIYKIPSAGGQEIRLTDAPGLDDGSEYSPDGKYIYFNSVRSGNMQLWRMNPDGSGQEQITHDTFNNWFPHISPDGKWIAFISYQSDVAPGDHPFYKKVYLRLMPADLSAAPHVIAYVYGGQGTINTPSWSPDSKRIAFVSNSGKWQ